jgi:hypothetical protein
VIRDDRSEVVEEEVEVVVEVEVEVGRFLEVRVLG